MPRRHDAFRIPRPLNNASSASFCFILPFDFAPLHAVRRTMSECALRCLNSKKGTSIPIFSLVAFFQTKRFDASPDQSSSCPQPRGVWWGILPLCFVAIHANSRKSSVLMLADLVLVLNIESIHNIDATRVL